MLKYSINRPITNVVVFGCGGTGSRVVPTLAQLLTSHEFTKNVRLILVDGDVVEEKNCKRQHFIKQEIDKNKAEVLARRYRLGFEARTEAVPFFVPSIEDQILYLRGINKSVDMNTVPEATREFFRKFIECLVPAGIDQSILSSNDSLENSLGKSAGLRTLLENTLFSNTSVLIMCVDSVDARMRILTLIQTLGYLLDIKSREALANMIVIDSGNEDIFGQVTYFNPVVTTLCPFPELLNEIPDRAPFSVGLRYVPFPIGKYMHMRDGESTKSCADLDQTLAINNMMAAMITMVFQNLLYGLEMDYHTINCNLNGAFYTDKMSLPWLKGVLSSDENYLKSVVTQLLDKDISNEEMDFMKNRSGPISKVPMFFSLGFGDSYHLPGTAEVAVKGMCKEFFPAGERNFLHVGGDSLKADRDISLRNYGTLPPNLSLKESLNLWKYTDYVHAHWANLVWPILMQGVISEYQGVTDTLKYYATLCSSMSYGSPFLYSAAMEDRSMYNILEVSYRKECWSQPPATGLRVCWYLKRSDLVGFGKQDLSSSSYKDVVYSTGASSLKLLGGKRILLPKDSRSLLAGCNFELHANRNQSYGKYVGTTYLIICDAILNTIPAKEIRQLYDSILRSFNMSDEVGNDVVLMKKIEAILMNRLNFLYGVSAITGERGGVSVIKKDKWGFSSSHTKGVPCLVDWNGGLFDDSLERSKYIISFNGAIIDSVELEGITVSGSEKEIRSILESA